MKKLTLIKTPVIFSSLLLMLSFTTIYSLKKDELKNNKKGRIATKKKPFCNCGTPVVTKTYLGANVTFSWTAVLGAVRYNFGGRYFGGSVFSYCLTTTGITIPVNSGGDYGVRALCDGSDCNSATCTGNPANGSF
jgi:hypothetical protein